MALVGHDTCGKVNGVVSFDAYISFNAYIIFHLDHTCIGCLLFECVCELHIVPRRQLQALLAQTCDKSRP